MERRDWANPSPPNRITAQGQNCAPVQISGTPGIPQKHGHKNRAPPPDQSPWVGFNPNPNQACTTLGSENTGLKSGCCLKRGGVTPPGGLSAAGTKQCQTKQNSSPLNSTLRTFVKKETDKKAIPKIDRLSTIEKLDLALRKKNEASEEAKIRRRSTVVGDPPDRKPRIGISPDGGSVSNGLGGCSVIPSEGGASHPSH